MKDYSQLSDSNNDSDSSDRSIEQPPSLRVLNEYTIQKELGRGAHGKVFLVTNAEENTYVVKEINYTDEKDLDKFREEVRLLKALNHPYVVDYEDSFIDKESGLLYIVMEYCEGDLYKMMQKQKELGFFEEQQILDWLVQMCLALQHVHEKNILHRDIKPQNILLNEDGYIELGDFGWSKLLDRADVHAKSVVGADLYVSPEVLDKNYDFKCDIWSLGWLLRNLCMLDVWSDIKEGPFLHACSMKGTLSHISERISEELRELIRKMLSCAGNDRPSAKEILEEPFLRQAVNRNKCTPKALEERFVEVTESIVEKYKDLKAFLIEWGEITDLLEDTHRKCTIGSLSGSVIGAAGGITALVGAILAPFTFGASLIVTGVGIGVGVAGGVTSAASNITNSVKQKALHKKIEEIGQKYNEVIQLILNSPKTLRLLRKIQKFRTFERDALLHDTEWLVTSNTFIILHAVRLSLRLFASIAKTGVLAGVEAGVAGARAGVQAGAQAARAGRAAAAAAEVAVAVAAVSGVLSGILIIVDAAFIAVDSREIHQMRQGKIDDPEKVTSSVLKGIAQMRKMHKEFENVLEAIIETRETIKIK